VRPQEPQHPLLPVAGRKFVSNDRVPGYPLLDFVGELTGPVAGLQQHLFDLTGLVFLPFGLFQLLVLLILDAQYFVLSAEFGVYRKDSVRFELGSGLHLGAHQRVSVILFGEIVFDFLVESVKVVVSGLVHAALAESPFVTAFVDDHRVFHVLAGLTHDSHDCIGARRLLVQVVVFVVLSADQRQLRELEPLRLTIEALKLVVVHVGHRLLQHLTLLHVSRRLVVIGQWSQ